MREFLDFAWMLWICKGTYLGNMYKRIPCIRFYNFGEVKLSQIWAFSCRAFRAFRFLSSYIHGYPCLVFA